MVVGVTRTWHLYVIDAFGVRQAEIDDYREATIVPRFNAVGSWAITFTGASPAMRLLELDKYGVEFVANSGGAATVVMSGRVAARDRSLDTSTSGVAETWTFTGVDDLALIAARQGHPQPGTVAPPYSSSAYDVRTGRASSVIAGFVNDNVGPGAITARRITGLTVAPDLGVGATITGRLRWRPLLDDITGLAAAGGVGFRIRSRVFETYLPVDRSATVKFSLPLGNLHAFKYSEERPTVNYVYVLGGGEGTARTVVEASDAVSVARWGRVEQSVDRRDTTDPAELAQAAQEALVEGAAKTGLSLSVVDTESVRYLEHYQLGDIVSVIVDGITVTDVVREVTITLNQDGERMAPTIGDPNAVPGKASIFQNVAKLAARVRGLERR